MEKFQSFTDAAVGVNPFAQRPARSSVLHWFVSLCKAIAVGPIFLVLAAFDSVALLFAFIPAVEWVLRSILIRPLCSLVLLLGFGIWPRHSVHLKQSRIVPSPAKPVAQLQPKDVALINSSSYLDVLYLASICNPCFLVDRRRATTSVLAALRSVELGGDTLGLSTEQDWLALLSSRTRQGAWCGPLVVRPEGAPSNGDGVLLFSPSASTLAAAVSTMPSPRRPTVHILGLRYASAKGEQQLTRTAGSLVSHAWRAAGVTHGHSITAWRLPEGCDPQPEDFLPTTGSPTDAHAQAWVAAAREALTACLRPGIRPVALGATHHASFLEAWAIQEGGKGGLRGKDKAA